MCLVAFGGLLCVLSIKNWYLCQRKLIAMKRIVIFSFLLLSLAGFSQTETEKMIDSVLVKKVGKTYKQYLLHFQEIDAEYKATTDKIRQQVQEKGNGRKTTKPTFPSKMYATEMYPLVVLYKGKKRYSLQNFSKTSFVAVKKVLFLDSQQGRAIYGTEGRFGVCFIEVE